jgi:hypothetical protein
MIKKTLFSMFAVSLITAFTAQADLINFTGTVYHDSGNLINASNAASGTNIGTFTGSTVNFSINSPDGSGTPMSSFFTGVTDSSTLKNSYWWNRVMSDPDNQFGHGVYSTGVVIDGTASFHAGDTVTITHDDGAILSLQGLGIVINSGAPRMWTAVICFYRTSLVLSISNTRRPMAIQSTWISRPRRPPFRSPRLLRCLAPGCLQWAACFARSPASSNHPV